MRTVRLSEEVWQVIASKGRFGETEDDVLRREFDLPPREQPKASLGVRPGRGAVRFATKRMSARVERDHLVIEFEGGGRKEWSLPKKSDKTGLRTIREDAVAWALSQGASDPGQTNAVRKALTDAGYYLTR